MSEERTKRMSKALLSRAKAKRSSSKLLRAVARKKASKKRASSKVKRSSVRMRRVRIPARFARRMTKQWKKTGWGVEVFAGPDHYYVQAMDRKARGIALRIYPDAHGGGAKIVTSMTVGDVTKKDVTSVVKMAHQIVWTAVKGIEAN